MKTKITQLPASQLPDGTLYCLASSDDGNSSRSFFSLAKVKSGKVTVVRATGNRRFRGQVMYGDPNGKQVVVIPDAVRPNPYVLSLSSDHGVNLPIKEGLWAGSYVYFLHSFSSVNRWLSYVWLRLDKNKPDLAKVYGGSGIYDSRSQQAWDQEGAMLGAWSRSGKQFVFARYFHKGDYLTSLGYQTPIDFAAHWAEKEQRNQENVAPTKEAIGPTNGG